MGCCAAAARTWPYVRMVQSDPIARALSMIPSDFIVGRSCRQICQYLRQIEALK